MEKKYSYPPLFAKQCSKCGKNKKIKVKKWYFFCRTLLCQEWPGLQWLSQSGQNKKDIKAEVIPQVKHPTKQNIKLNSYREKGA